jgi:nitroreductase/NAD-dependent dihydropyrimidine dehydrogenase PreA subunit
MALLSIDQDKCKRDGLCATDCPMKIIRFDGPNHYPEMIDGGEAYCLRCGHCVAACPHGALDHAEVPLAQCPSIDPALTISPAQAEQFLRSRRSVRRFKDKPIEQELLQQLIETARYAPTASNAQHLAWRVINDPQRVQTIAGEVIGWMRALVADPKATVMPYMPLLIQGWDAGIDTILRSAPCLVVAMAPSGARHGMVDLTLALSYLELIASVNGLGTCWAGLLQGALIAVPGLKELVGISSDYPFFYPMMIGHANTRYYRLPQRKAAKIEWEY